VRAGQESPCPCSWCAAKRSQLLPSPIPEVPTTPPSQDAVQPRMPLFCLTNKTRLFCLLGRVYCVCPAPSAGPLYTGNGAWPLAGTPRASCTVAPEPPWPTAGTPPCSSCAVAPAHPWPLAGTRPCSACTVAPRGGAPRGGCFQTGCARGGPITPNPQQWLQRLPLPPLLLPTLRRQEQWLQGCLPLPLSLRRNGGTCL